MLQEDLTEFSILRKVVPPFLEVANYYLGESIEAQAARAKVERHTGPLGPSEPFHGEVYTRLLLLDELINKSTSSSSYVYHDATGAVQKLLTTLERLAKVGDGEKTSSYPKLHAIIVKWEEECESDEHSETDGEESRLWKDIRLACPKVYLRRELRDNLDAAYNALTTEFAASKEDNAHDIVSQAASETQIPIPSAGARASMEPSITEWTQAGTAARAIKTIYQFLEQRWGCSCPIPHAGIKVSFVTTQHEVTQETIGSFYFEKEQLHTWRSAEIRLGVDHNERVRFSDAAEPLSRTSNQQTERSMHVESLCETLHNTQTRLSLIATRSGLLQETLSPIRTCFGEDVHGGSAVSISHLVRSLTYAGADLKERMILAVLLAYAYLHLSGGPWWPDDRITPDVWFFTTPNEPLPNLRRPYFSALIQTSTAEGANIEVPAFMKGLNKHKPSLLVLGKLLMELFVGHPVSWLPNARGEKYIYDAIRESQCNRMGGLYAAAVEACIKDVDEALSKGGSFEKNEASRAAFLSRVIDKLETIVEVRYGSMNVLMESNALQKSIPTAPADESSDMRTSPWQAKTITSRITELRGRSKPDDDVQQPMIAVGLVPPVTTNLCCLHDDNGKEERLDLLEAKEADEWFEKLSTFLHSIYTEHDLRLERREPVKVAIIDTGAHFDRDTLDTQYDNRIEKFQTWKDLKDGVHGRALPLGGVDEDGHGTHVTSVLLNVAQFCKVYVAQVFTTDLEHRALVSRQDSREVGTRIANAIRHAANKWKVDIVVMSFGFENKVDKIEDAIREALSNHHKRGILFFAAASNCGANDSITWPASRTEVICINSATGKGNPYRSTPTPQENRDNFSTLGSSVKGCSPPPCEGKKCGTVHRSGTSTATPVAAGIAAILIDLMRVKQEWYLEHHWPNARKRRKAREEYRQHLCDLKRYAGMQRVLKKISVKHRDYDWLAPWSTLKAKRYAHPTDMIGDLIKELKAQ